MKTIQNKLHGYHLNSRYWQDWKRKRPNLSPNLFQLALGMTLSDAAMYRVSREAYMKFEQGHAQKEFIDHLFAEMKEYSFMQTPGIRYTKTGEVKSYWFKTFSHPTFSKIYELFYNIPSSQTSDGKVGKRKCIAPSLVLRHLEKQGLAYWIMGDGSLHREGRVLTLHTQSYSYEENLLLSQGLNEKFGFTSKVVRHKTSFVVQFTTQDANLLHGLIGPSIIESMKYKIPRKL